MKCRRYEEISVKIIMVAGARPNFIKIAPLVSAFATRNNVETVLVHTGQHYDERMSQLFFRELAIPKPDINLNVGSGSHAVQTADIMVAFEAVLKSEGADAVLVVGDVNSTIACSLVAAKLGVKVIHVEAGLRSFDRTMPEEINRVLTDSISDLLFCTEQSGVDNLLREGVAEDKIFLVGNVMIDTLKENMEKATQSEILEALSIGKRRYAVLTLHRPTNVDDASTFSMLLDAVDVVQREMPVVFPIHPRTRNQLEATTLWEGVAAMENVVAIDPLGYLDFVKLLSNARIVFTDSGGIQEETTIMMVPCITLRGNTERPITVEMGSNQVAGTDPKRILEAYRKALTIKRENFGVPPLWDGKAADRIVDIVTDELSHDSAAG